MNKGFSLVEVMVAIVVMSSLFVVCSTLFIKGKMIEQVATDSFDKEYEINILEEVLDKFYQSYQGLILIKSSNYFLTNNQIVINYSSEKVDFLIDDILYSIPNNLDIQIDIINNNLLVVEYQNDRFNTIRYFYMGEVR